MTKQMLRGYVVRASKDGPIPFVASTPDAARGDGLSIPGTAWDTAAFERNPVLIWSHNYWDRPPIGRVVNLQKKDRGLLGEAVFDKGDDFAQEVERKMRAGFISAFSVGFAVHEMEPDKKTVKRAELYEVSVVAVPADPNALAEARQLARSLAPPADETRSFLEHLAGVQDDQDTPDPEQRVRELLKPLTVAQRRQIDELEARRWNV